MIVVDKQRVQEKQLSNRIDDVDGFDAQVGGDQVIAVELTADDAADFDDEAFETDATAGSVVALRQQVAVHLVDDVIRRRRQLQKRQQQQQLQQQQLLLLPLLQRPAV